MPTDYELRVLRRNILAAARDCAGCGYAYRRAGQRLTALPSLGVALCAWCRRDFGLRFGRGPYTQEQYLEWHRVRWNRELVP